MSMKRPANLASWEDTARELAARLIFHDYCPEVDEIGRAKHPHWDSGLIDSCPFCVDRYAMACYYARRMNRPKPAAPIQEQAY